MTVDKKYFIIAQGNKGYATYDDAVTQAKKMFGNRQNYGGTGDLYITEVVAVATEPVPDIVVTKL